MDNDLIHGTSVAYKGCGFLIRGKPGSGKSDLALRIIMDGGKLIADDQTMLHVETGKLIATCPDPIKSKLEVRGIGIIDLKSKHCDSHQVDVIIDLKAGDEIERLPEPGFAVIQGMKIPKYDLDATTASSLDKIKLLAEIFIGSFYQSP